MKVSVIIPVYNGQGTVQKAIDSVLNQKFPKKDFEVIVINDGSTDNTLEILKSYGQKIRLINREKNQGFVRAANRGFKAAKGTGQKSETQSTKNKKIDKAVSG